MRELRPDEQRRNWLRDLTDDGLMEHAEITCNHLSELEAEIGSEVAMFGDSWPGSANSLSAIREAVAEVDAEILRRGLREPRDATVLDFPRPMSFHVPPADDDDIPSDMATYCEKCEDTGWLSGEAEGNYHDCGTCNPADPTPGCPECVGAGYVVPSVKCDACAESL